MGVCTDKATKVTLQGLVDSLCLSVNFWVICSAHAQLGAGSSENGLPKMAREHWVTIRDKELG
jgi:hypothetical protein